MCLFLPSHACLHVDICHANLDNGAQLAGGPLVYASLPAASMWRGRMEKGCVGLFVAGTELSFIGRRMGEYAAGESLAQEGGRATGCYLLSSVFFHGPQRREYAAGEFLAQEGERAEEIFYIEAGAAEICYSRRQAADEDLLDDAVRPLAICPTAASVDGRNGN